MARTPTLFDNTISQNERDDKSVPDGLERVKQIGWMPKEWGLQEIGQFGNIVTGTTPKTSETHYYGGPYPFISPGDMGEGMYVQESEKTLSEVGFSEARPVPAGSVLFVSIGSSIGKVAITTEPAATNQQINAVVPDDRYQSEFIYHMLSYHADRIHVLAGVQAVPSISKSTFKSESLPVPSPEERNRIVFHLNAWERAIEQIENSIEKKEQYLCGLRQRLFTGRVRFPGFDEAWTETTLGEYLRYFSDRNNDGKDLPVLSCSKVHGIIPQSEKFDRRVASKDTSNYKVVERGNLVYDPMLLWDGSIGFVDCVDQGVVSPAYYTFQFNEQHGDRDFFRHLLATHRVKYQYEAISQGTNTRRQKAPRDAFLGIEVKVPSLKEQQKIAEMMRSAETEIQKLKEKREALKRQKKGLMQRLLTGAVRTV